ncbi:hypothetical protein CY35_07G017700 [Sphagnum magellanicum]|uniref:Uncharacterized protein n=1 Tax=Sphagnum magellanicum TaxID=128215 RepID=A0ACB8HJB9_9BRYO|nr:hypothetical protein CY35_07G017700 [Sphagnum magellanicum]
MSSLSTTKLSPTPLLKQRVSSKRPELILSSAKDMELESRTEDSGEELRDLSPNSLEISIPELQQRIKRILEDDPASPNPEETAIKALSHLRHPRFPSPPPWSAKGSNNNTSTGNRAGFETLRTTPLLSGRNKSTESRPYDPKQNFLSPRPQFLRYRPNRRLDLLQRSPTAAEIQPDTAAGLKVAELNQSGSEGIRAAEMVEVENSDHGGISESCNSSVLVVAAEDLLSSICSLDSLRIVKQTEELENGVPGPLGTTVEVGIEDRRAGDDTKMQEAANMSRSEDLSSGVEGATDNVESSIAKIIEEDSAGIQEAASMLQSLVKDDEGIPSPKRLLLLPKTDMNSEVVKETLCESETSIQDILDTPPAEVEDKMITNLSEKKGILPMFVTCLAGAFLVSTFVVVLMAFLSSSILSGRRASDANPLVEPWKNLFSMHKPSIHFSTFGMAFLESGYVRSTHAMTPLVEEPWQNLSHSNPSVQFSSFDSHFGIKGTESVEIKTRKAENHKSSIVIPSQSLTDKLDVHGSNLQDSSEPGIIVEPIEAVRIEQLPQVPTSGSFQAGQGDMQEFLHLVKAVMEDDNLQDEGAPDISCNEIESNFDAGLSTEVPEEGDALNTECTTLVHMSASSMREDSLAIPPSQGKVVESSEEGMAWKQTWKESLHKTVDTEESIGGITINSVMGLGDHEGGMCSVPSVELSVLGMIPEFILVGMASAAVAAALAVPLRRFMKRHKKSHKAIHRRKPLKAKEVISNAPQAHTTDSIKPKTVLEPKVANDTPPQPAATAALKAETDDSVPIHEHKIASSRNSLRKVLVEPALSGHTMSPTPHTHSLTTPVMRTPVGSFLPTVRTPVPSNAPSISYMPSESSMSTASGFSGASSVADSELSALLDNSQLGSFTAYEPILSNEGSEMQELKLTPVRRSMRIRNKVASPLLAYKVKFPELHN